MTLALHQAHATGSSCERALVQALRRGDEKAFAELVGRYHVSMKRIARAYVASDAVAEEVVQETWLGVVGGIHGFEGRSSVKTWIFRILLNRARTKGPRERRSVPFSSLQPHDAGGPSVDEDRFHGPGSPSAGAWSAPPRAWEDPYRRAVSLEVRGLLCDAIAGLPQAQQLVVTMRDVEGLSSDETCELLGLTPGNQRVLLHRARSRLRAVLEDELG